MKNLEFNQTLDRWPNVNEEGGLRLKEDQISQKQNRPLITIITVVYNNEKYLEECLKSLYSQKEKNFEHIIIDGSSSDNTIKIT